MSPYHELLKLRAWQRTIDEATRVSTEAAQAVVAERDAEREAHARTRAELAAYDEAASTIEDALRARLAEVERRAEQAERERSDFAAKAARFCDEQAARIDAEERVRVLEGALRDIDTWAVNGLAHMPNERLATLRGHIDAALAGAEPAKPAAPEPAPQDAAPRDADMEAVLAMTVDACKAELRRGGVDSEAVAARGAALLAKLRTDAAPSAPAPGAVLPPAPDDETHRKAIAALVECRSRVSHVSWLCTQVDEAIELLQRKEGA
jgi:hypothetical protein